MSAWDVGRIVLAVPIAVVAFLVALCNCWYCWRVVVRGDSSSPSPMPIAGTICAVLIGLILPLESTVARLGIAGLLVLGTDGAMFIAIVAESIRDRLGLPRR